MSDFFGLLDSFDLFEWLDSKLSRAIGFIWINQFRAAKPVFETLGFTAKKK